MKKCAEKSVLTKHSLCNTNPRACRLSNQWRIYTNLFKKTFMDTIKIFMAIPDRINILQLGRYGCFSELTYRNLFEQTSESWIFTSIRRLQPST